MANTINTVDTTKIKPCRIYVLADYLILNVSDIRYYRIKYSLLYSLLFSKVPLLILNIRYFFWLVLILNIDNFTRYWTKSISILFPILFVKNWTKRYGVKFEKSSLRSLSEKSMEYKFQKEVKKIFIVTRISLI